MQNLTRASEQLYRRTPDERFASVTDLWDYCHKLKEWSTIRWVPTADVNIGPMGHSLRLPFNGETFSFNDWSFTQLCSLAGVSKDTINRLSPDTASCVFLETLPRGSKPLQVLTMYDTIRSVHGASYTRLFNVELLAVIKEFAVDFQPPQATRVGSNEDPDTPPATGLYCGEQDMFCFFIDPTGWTEIEGEPFAPGFFVWNSEVGRRSIGIQTFWFQAICQNHIVWDAVEVVEYKRKHTTNVHEALRTVRHLIEQLVKKRDQRRDAFVNVITNAMQTKLGEEAEDVLKVLRSHGIPKAVASEALKMAAQQGKFTIFSLVNALTRLARRCEYAGDRTEADTRSSSLLALAV